ncbi:glycosyltransferase family 2 protein [Shimia sp.]|uniref:glycosyltransferase family 2 protein n=1 Tax=Shimia sp. TaxID=1954381 RepID=UPI00329A63A4
MEGQRLVRPAPTIGLVVPAMNEAQNLPFVLSRIPDLVDEVILVDGNSSDDTIAVAKSLMPNIRVVSQDRKGKGAALRNGFEACTCDIIIAIDADGSMDPREIAAYVGALLAGADFVKGSRFVQGGGTDDMEWYRRLGNWGFVKMVNWRFGVRFSDLCYGYFGFWKKSLGDMSLARDDGFEIEASLKIQALRSGLAIHEVPSKEAQRIHGVSNLRTIQDGWRVLVTILRLSFTRVNSDNQELVSKV